MQPDGELIEMYLRSVRAVAGSFSRSSGIPAEDLLQEVACKFIVKWMQIISAREPLPYARVVAKNAMIDLYNEKKRKQAGKMWDVSLDRPLHADSDLTLLDVLEG